MARWHPIAETMMVAFDATPSLRSMGGNMFAANNSVYVWSRSAPPPPNGLGSRPPILWCGLWWLIGNPPLPPSGNPLPSSSPCGAPSFPLCGAWWGEFVLGSLGGVESVVLPKWGLLVVVKVFMCAKTIFCGEDCVLRPWDVRLGVWADLGDSC